MSTELILKALIALLPVIVLIVVLYRLDSHRLLGTHFIVRMFLVGGVVAVLCSFVNAFAIDSLSVEFNRYTLHVAPLIEEMVKASIIVYLFRTNRIGFVSDRMGNDEIFAADAEGCKYTVRDVGFVDLVEANEAFAAQACAVNKDMGWDPAIVNVNGGAISLGHPLGATGTKLMTTLLHELERSGGKYGLQTMCEGGGQANVTIIERL